MDVFHSVILDIVAKNINNVVKHLKFINDHYSAGKNGKTVINIFTGRTMR